jgi:hypothetical protein
MTSELGVRERKKQAARTALTEAALRLFQANGFDATTVNDIAPQQLEGLRRFLADRPSSESNAVALRAALAAFAEVLEGEREELNLRRQLARGSRTLAERAAIELQNWRLALTEELMQRPTDRDHTRCHLLAGFGVHVLTVAITLRGDADRTLPELTQHCWQELAEVVRSP